MAQDPDWLTDLLVKRATENLSADEAHAFMRLSNRQSLEEAESFDRAAAAIHLAALGPLSPMPASVRSRLEASAESYSAEKSTVRRRPAGPLPAPAPVGRQRNTLAWLVAAAALAVAVIGWLPPTPVVAPTLAEQRAALLAQGAVLTEWASTDDPTGANATGDVVWEHATQTGFMRFTGLAANRPTQFQYQLWIFDGLRGDQYPVDGGIFDIPAGADEVIVPITAKLPVGDAVLFAVTVEQPGGVVVSTRDRITLVAEPG